MTDKATCSHEWIKLTFGTSVCRKCDVMNHEDTLLPIDRLRSAVEHDAGPLVTVRADDLLSLIQDFEGGRLSI